MKNRRESDDALAAEYALGTLRNPARLHFERRLKTDKELAERVAKWQTLLSGLDSSLMPVIPPANVWKKIALNLPQNTTSPRWKKQALSWGLAAGLGFLSLTTWFYWPGSSLQPLAVLSGSLQGEWIISTDTDRNIVRVSPLNMTTVSDTRSLQLWMIPAGSKPISIGLLDPKSAQQFTLTTRRLVKGTVMAISLEPVGGSPTGQPTGPVVFSAVLKT